MFGAFALWIVLLVGAVGVANYLHFGLDVQDYSYSLEAERCIDFSEFMERVEAGMITEVHFQNSTTITGYVANTSGAQSVYTKIPPRMSCESIVWRLIAKGVRVRVDDGVSSFATFLGYALQWAVPIFLALSLIYVMRGRRGLFGFDMLSGVKDADVPDIGFADVAGVDDAKDSLTEIVQFLKNPTKFRRLGAAVPRGVLLYGPPGTGKTLLARCVAGESSAAFMYAAGSSFVELYVGMGAKKIREAFKKARSKAPCVIFIDEIDAVAGKRRAGVGDAGSEEHAQTLTQLLEELDGFDEHPESVVVIIGATNRRDAMDPAALRPGRFDRHIYVGNPDLNGRKQIISVHLKRIKHDPDLDINFLARKTQGFSGAEIRNLINEAALIATRDEKKEFVDIKDFLIAWDNIIAGPVRNRLVTEERRKLVAYHETGHAIVALLTDHAKEVDRVTITPRGNANGMLISLPQEADDGMYTRAQMLDEITVTLGGRAAEFAIFGKDRVTTGASSDFKHATDLAHMMVFQWGMQYDDSDNGVADDCNLVSYSPYVFNSVTEQIPQEILNKRGEMVREIVHKCYRRALKIVKDNRKQVDRIVEYLLERETLNKEELEMILAGKKLEPLEPVVVKAEKGADGGGDENTLSGDTKSEKDSAQNAKGERTTAGNAGGK